MPQHFLLDESGNLPAAAQDWYAFLTRLEVRSEADAQVMLTEIKSLDLVALQSYCDHFIKLNSDPDLLLMVYAQPDIVGKMDEKLIYQNFGAAYHKLRSQVIDQPLFEKMITGLISGYTNREGESFLPQLRFFLKMKLDSYIGFPVGPLFDQAMADHVASFPCSPSRQSDTNFNLSKLALAQVYLPLTLEVFVRQQMEISAMQEVARLVTDYFAEFKKNEGYIDVFRRVLGDDVFSDLCMQANLNKGSLASVIKLAPLFGEASFHNEAFFQTLTREDGRLYKSEYLADLKYFPNFEENLPILADYLLQNLESTLSQLADYGNQDYLRQILSLAVRNGRGVEAYEYVIDAVRAPVSDAGLVHADEVSREELIEAMCKNVQSYKTHVAVQRAWYILQTFTLDVGFETLHKVMPGVDRFFLTNLLEQRGGAMEEMGITLNHHDLVKKFPQIKGHLLEDAMGL